MNPIDNSLVVFSETPLQAKEGLMDGNLDILMRLREEEWSLLRHYKDQRATVTNLLLLVTRSLLALSFRRG